jgi:hypothetical protein
MVCPGASRPAPAPAWPARRVGPDGRCCHRHRPVTVRARDRAVGHRPGRAAAAVGNEDRKQRLGYYYYRGSVVIRSVEPGPGCRVRVGPRPAARRRAAATGLIRRSDRDAAAGMPGSVTWTRNLERAVPRTARSAGG